MSGVVKKVKKVFRKVGKTVAKVAPIALAGGAAMFTVGSYFNVPGMAGGWSGAMQRLTDFVGLDGTLGKVVGGALTKAGYGALIGGGVGAVAGDALAGAQIGAAGGAVLGGLQGGLQGGGILGAPATAGPTAVPITNNVGQPESLLSEVWDKPIPGIDPYRGIRTEPLPLPGATGADTIGGGAGRLSEATAQQALSLTATPAQQVRGGLWQTIADKGFGGDRELAANTLVGATTGLLGGLLGGGGEDQALKLQREQAAALAANYGAGGAVPQGGLAPRMPAPVGAQRPQDAWPWANISLPA